MPKGSIETAQTEFEKHVISWCLENTFALKFLNLDKICLVKYEDMCRQPEAVFEKINNYLGETLKKMDRSVISKPSFMAGKNNLSFLDTTKHLERWEKKIKKEEFIFLVKTLERFGINRYYDLSTYKIKL